MTSKEFAKALRKYLKNTDARLKKISVRIGRGTARSYGWISGSKEFGYFTADENEALNDVGFTHGGLNGICLDWQDQKYLVGKFGL